MRKNNLILKLSSMFRFVISIFIFNFIIIHTDGQDFSRLKNQSWIRIMENDTSVNYFKAQKDYAKFRKAHLKEEAKEEKRRKKLLAKNGEHFINEPHLENPEEAAMMRYERWARSMKPF